MARLVGLLQGVLVNFGLWQIVEVRTHLRLLVAWLEELEGVGWKELEVVGRECGSPGKLQVLGFLRGLSALRLFHEGGRLSVTGQKRNIPVSKSGGIPDKEGVGCPYHRVRTDTRVQAL